MGIKNIFKLGKSTLICVLIALVVLAIIYIPKFLNRAAERYEDISEEQNADENADENELYDEETEEVAEEDNSTSVDTLNDVSAFENFYECKVQDSLNFDDLEEDELDTKELFSNIGYNANQEHFNENKNSSTPQELTDNTTIGAKIENFFKSLR